MAKNKALLLKELAALGVNMKTGKPPRKQRSDIGKVRGVYAPRSDIGQPRGSYVNTAAKYKAVYDKMLKGHKVAGSGDGADTLTRDYNDIFPPNLTRYSRLMHSQDREYYTSALKPAHLEQARWRWMMAEYQENPAEWGPRIAAWYFIKVDEIDMWMYTEWAWAYVNYISGVENRLNPTPLVLIYADYVAGEYNGRPVFDKRGEIIWTT